MCEWYVPQFACGFLMWMAEKHSLMLGFICFTLPLIILLANAVRLLFRAEPHRKERRIQQDFIARHNVWLPLEVADEKVRRFKEDGVEYEETIYESHKTNSRGELTKVYGYRRRDPEGWSEVGTWEEIKKG